jgi:hypothetical protein
MYADPYSPTDSEVAQRLTLIAEHDRWQQLRLAVLPQGEAVRSKLRAYAARRRVDAPSTRIVSELSPLIDRALEAGLDRPEIVGLLNDG